jgi:[acyl-carrier-protein] S-malonyltransferase
MAGNNNNSKNLRERLSQTALAFRGYNVTNLGRTPELLAHPKYGPIVADYLERGSRVCREVTGQPADLVSRVRQRQETDLPTYHEAMALVVAVEMAQLHLLRELFDVDVSKARVMYGFSLGEIAALVAGGVLEMADALRIPLAMSHDCAELARDVTLGVLFSRGRELKLENAHRLCLRINHEGQGVMGVSCQLSPNSLLLIGQGDTLNRFEARLGEVSSERLHLRKNLHRWPPLHTPIMWERNIPNRSSRMMHTVPGAFTAPVPPIISLVTGQVSYTETNAREILGRWIDHPQLLWDAVDQTLSMGIETVIHVGPEPNIFPATFNRLALDVEVQTRGSLRMRALSGIIRRPWLQNLLPKRASLLRAPLVKHVMLEDWLLQQAPTS